MLWQTSSQPRALSPTRATASPAVHRPHVPWIDAEDRWPYSLGMATTTIKSTYALDVETVGALEALARRWNVSKSEAMRRVIRASAAAHAVNVAPEPLQALDELQKMLALAPAAAARWSSQVRADRRAGSRRREEQTR